MNTLNLNHLPLKHIIITAAIMLAAANGRIAAATATPGAAKSTIVATTSAKKVTATPPNSAWQPEFNNAQDTSCRRNFKIGIKTNMLYDALLVPNLGVDICLGRHWSFVGNWMYAWWKNDRKHNYWRTYGGDVEMRYWFGSRNRREQLAGHHIGVYGQMITYDFELGGRGYLGDKWSYAGGISYGYSLPIGRRFNLDFTLGIGYMQGEYMEYDPIDGHYVWQSTKSRKWLGPTKAEVSLVWLIGKKNSK